jgi:putative hydrolase of the HAD superfamily
LRREGLLVDFGGVLTTNVFESFAAFCRDEGLPEHHVRDAFRSDPTPRQLLFELELGQLPAPEFERRFAAAIGLGAERAEGLVTRLFEHAEPDEAMLGAVAAAKRAGVRTGLISNSWGEALVYDRDRFPELFDAWVISHEVGLRKPDPEIYALTLERLGLPAGACLFLDDLDVNVAAARELGFRAIQFHDTAQAIAEIEAALAAA